LYPVSWRVSPRVYTLINAYPANTLIPRL